MISFSTTGSTQLIKTKKAPSVGAFNVIINALLNNDTSSTAVIVVSGNFQ